MPEAHIPFINQLEQWQENFADFLLSEKFNDEHLLATMLAQQDAEHSKAGLQIYRNNVHHSLCEALCAQFPAVKNLIGEEFFMALAQQYICSEPPTSPILTFYGETFPDFISKHQACRKLLWLSEVAALEFLTHKMLHAADSETISLAQMAALDQNLLPDLCLALISGASLLTSAWAIDQLYSEALKLVPQRVANVKYQTTLLVYRRAWEVSVITLQPAAFSLLALLQQQQTLGVAWDIVSARFELADTELAPMLTYLFGLDVFSRYYFPQTGINSAS